MPPHLKCDKVHVGACLVVIHPTTKQWLMIHRIGEHGFNKWSVPGGWMDINETPKKAVLRELAEELGPDLSVSPPKIFAHTNDPVDLDKNHLWHSYTVWLKASYLSGTPENMEPEKVDKIGWIDPYLIDKDDMFGPLHALLEKIVFDIPFLKR